VDAPPVEGDAEGKFERPLPPGTYSFEVSASGYEPVTLTAQVRSGEKTVLDLALKRRSIIGGFAGTVKDPEGNPLKATLTFSEPGVPPLLTDPTDGSFSTLLAEGEYEVTIRAEGYETKTYRFPVIAGKKTVMDFVLPPEILKETEYAMLSGNRILLLKPIQFEPGSSLLKEDSYPVLKAVAKILLSLPRKTVRVEAHTHNLGPREVNRKLSQRRAESCVEYLRKLGVPQDRLKPVGKGEDFPIAPNTTPEGRAKNERVEFYIE
jgi:outer membrane protein OmpA-like peptidoglycan-associated protein